jgi:translation initiation factor 1A
MPKKGKKRKNAKNNKGPTVTRPLLLKEDGQEYAEALKMLGDRRLSVRCYDGVERLGRIRGSMRRGRQNRISAGDHVLVSLRDFTEKCVDVIHKYNDDEVRRLRKMGELVDIGTEKRQDASDEDVDEQDAFTFEEI